VSTEVEGCTSCASKPGCDTRKDDMFAELWATLARLYPTRTWGELDDDVAFTGGVDPALGPVLAARLAEELGTAAYFQPGSEDETCDYIYVMCMGREPSLWQVGAGLAAVPAEKISELYLRVALSSVAPFAAVQQVLVELRPRSGMMMLTEEPRGGVFEAQLLPRMQKLVAVLIEAGLRHLDFGEITAAPADYQAGRYRDQYGGEPWVVNYLFYPQSPTAVATRYLEPG
jgi:hypothetical protein